ncbi:MAG: ADOP family duplicated permease [Terracidiphilus sp.]
MKEVRVLWKRLCGTFGRERANDEIDEEIEMHVELDTERGVREGLRREEARRQALIRLGGAEQVRTAYRERNSLPWLESLAGDLRYSFRTLRKHPGVTAAAVLSIGLGIGCNATIFSMVSRFVLRPAPVGDAATLVAVNPESGVGGFSWPLYEDIRDQVRSFSGVAAYFPLLPASVSGSGEPERVWGQLVTANFFEVAELRMLRGRGFVSGEEQEPVAVLSAGLWRRQFGGDPAIVGKSITISGHSFVVVGIAPASFHGIDQLLYAEFWVPLGNAERMIPSFPSRTDRNDSMVWITGRLRPGVTRAQAAAELDALTQRLAASYPNIYSHHSFVLTEAGMLPPSSLKPILIFLTALLVVVLLVLAIAAFNVANLLFAQAVARQREMAVRLALGAGRGRLRRQMLMESVLLGLCGGAAGLLLSLWATRGLASFRLPVQIPIDLSVGMDWRVLAGTFLLSAVSGLLLGAAPAWAASRPALMNALKGEDALARPARRWTLRNLLTIAQIAMATILLSMTGLFLRSLESAATIDPGFQPRGILTMSVDPRLYGYSAEKTTQFLSQVRERVAALPGVVSAAWTDHIPLSMINYNDAFGIAGEQNSGKDKVNADLYLVTPGYFGTMGIPQVEGRDFREGKGGAMTAIVNRAFAEKVFGGASAVGQQVTNGKDIYEIAGVVGDVRSTLGEKAQPTLYRSLDQVPVVDPFVGYTLVVRAAGKPGALMEAVRRQIRMLAPGMAIYGEETMDEHVRNAYFLPRLAATLFGIFGGIGLALAAVGLYGVMSYGVSRRSREIGIRMAMGAQPGRVERLVLRQGLVLSVIAVALGWPAAWMLAKLSASFLYGIEPHDLATFVVVPVILAGVALVACWIPARRAASINPMEALRAE